MPKKYTITPLLWFVRDEASVKFHVASDDYFGTIATIISLLEGQIKKDDVSNVARLQKTIKNLKCDLLFLQKNYQIKPKAKNKKITPKGRLKSQ